MLLLLFPDIKFHTRNSKICLSCRAMVPRSPCRLGSWKRYYAWYMTLFLSRLRRFHRITPPRKGRTILNYLYLVQKLRTRDVVAPNQGLYGRRLLTHICQRLIDMQTTEWYCERRLGVPEFAAQMWCPWMSISSGNISWHQQGVVWIFIPDWVC